MIIKDSRKLHEDAGSDWKIEELLGDRTLKNAIKKKRYATSSVSIHNVIDELNTQQNTGQCKISFKSKSKLHTMKSSQVYLNVPGETVK